MKKLDSALFLIKKPSNFEYLRIENMHYMAERGRFVRSSDRETPLESRYVLSVAPIVSGSILISLLF